MRVREKERQEGEVDVIPAQLHRKGELRREYGVAACKEGG